ncbi:MAG: hypothetical protein EB078_06285 [Proteobacteria bacterium]|nr:hypothetical protein [Pseudomonadota bacterium]NDC22975.1 hypothetical protein [Pseudomonadota bacterium]NDD04494.1 hypothetical protein [Pseudomonadota bacterium]NDG25560.1 hypothetical protein [Pseudomonadota bacterium]
MKSILLVVAFGSLTSHAALPEKFDLRNTDGKSFVSSVKNQKGGTCWTHATMAGLESNLMMTGAWSQVETQAQPNLAEYHLDWWNGFNDHWNPDSGSGGLTVHEGGDYRVATAALSRKGAMRDSDAQSYKNPPQQTSPDYHTYYVRDVEWFDAGPNLENIDGIKEALMNHGAMGTALHWANSYYDSYSNTFYQSPQSSKDPNHAVAIVGWDDQKQTEAAKPGAWLIKNSWGPDWGDDGFFWISYYDKVAGHHSEMGAVSFKNVELQKYQHIYSHDTHGWRDTKDNVFEAFNAFKAEGISGGPETLRAVSFYTTEDQSAYTIDIFGSFENGELKHILTRSMGSQPRKGFHTVDLDFPISLEPGQTFYVAVTVSKGGHAFDRTSNVPVLLGSEGRITVPSVAHPGESFYKQNGQWVDLTTFNPSANFCIKALTN